MTPEQFQRVKAIYLDLQELSPDHARQQLPAACGDDPVVLAEVGKMLGIRADDTILAKVTREVDKLLLGQTPTLADMLGQRVGPYEVLSLIGQGGMGVVYRARDTRLGRQAALKAVLPGDDDQQDRIERLRREARLLASLSHPNLATVYGLEEAHGTLFLAMEHVEGVTLSQRLGRNGLPIAEALRYCVQIAAGVEEAHDAGVIHRDLKPSNIVVTDEGTPKVLDFGLARELKAPHAERREESRHATLTRQGSFFGTPAYMSPEQIRGETLDQQTDIFSFGSILFRCLTGRPAFDGDNDAEMLEAILHHDPEWKLLPAETPALVRQVLRRTLAKDRARRYRHIGDARLDLEDALAERAWEKRTPKSAPTSLARRLIPWAALAVGAAALAASQWLPRGATVARSEQVVHRFDAQLPGDTRQNDLERLQLALSPNGRDLVVACTSATGSGIWRRSHSDGQWRFIDKTENGHRPIVSRDGEWVGFFRDDHFYKQRVSGRGEPIRLAAISNWYGATWSDDGSLIYAPSWGAGLQHMRPDGSTVQLSKLNVESGESSHVSPYAIPGTRWVLFNGWTGGEECSIFAVNLDTQAQHPVLSNASTPRFATTPQGNFLLFERSSIIFAIPFDPVDARTAGKETAIAEGVLNDGTRFAAYFDVASDGTLAYVPGVSFTEENRLSYVNPDGSTEPLNNDRLSFAEPMFSANNQKMSVTIKGKLYKLLVYDLARQTKQYLLTGGDTVAHALSPDGKQVAVSVHHDGGYTVELFSAIDGTRQRRLVEAGADYHSDFSWSTDGKHLCFTMSEKEGVPRDLWVVPTDGSSAPVKVVATGAADGQGSISPDNRWIAYCSDNSGRREVYLVTCPDGKQMRQVSFDGGESPAWSPDGKRLYFISPQGLVYVEMSDDGIATGRPVVVYDKPFGQSDTVARNFSIAPDGRPVIVEPSERRAAVDQLNIITNWYELLHK